ncbi:hypothetical protein RHGRI_031125 [Rhododendron griersonianum]|uniref:Protein kinase domain-containing protein n=1 Tax=Rhododendron griersonianum TaxID=479676 RepID=A0AAV6IA44_9ERIC|nr:hypothetical protein RHGRI_031125 [Rhododendron griersonianum]
MYLAKDLDEVLAKVTPGALVVDDIDLTKISKPAKKTSRSEGPSSTSSLKRKGTQEVTKLESEETPKKKKRLQKLSEKKTPTEKVAAIAGRTRSSTKTSSPDQAESKETIHQAESTPTTEVKKRKTKTAPIKETQEEEETEKVEMEKSPSLVSSDSSPASLEATPEDPPVDPEHEASSQTPEKSRLSPFKPEPPTAQKDETVEEEADEDMEDFFKTAASLVQVSLSGISGDGSRPVVVLVIIGIIWCTFTRIMGRGIASGLQHAAAIVPPASNGEVQLWKMDAPTMERFLEDVAKEKLVRFTAQQLCSFTANYSKVLGAGGFGIVYKGQFPNGVKIAVKDLKRNSHDKTAEEQFMAEGGGGTQEWGPLIALIGSPTHVWDEYEKGGLATMTLSYGIEEKDRERAQRMAMVALWCVQDSPENRPPMSTVVKMLEGEGEIMPPPKPFRYLYSVGNSMLNPPTFTGNGSDSDEGTKSHWYKERTTTIMAKYDIQIASS